MSPARLSASNVSYQIAERLVLNDICLDLSAGQSLAVTGPSGAGKTTLMHLLAGVIYPTKGKVLLDGSPVLGREASSRRIGLLLQNSGLIPDLTAAENIALPMQARRLPPRIIAARTEAALAAVGLGNLGARFADQLSGGQQQRVGLARALAGDTDVIIADEPTSELDGDNRAIVIRLLRGEVARGKIVVVATHDADVGAACDTEIKLADGRVLSASPAS
jgi:putative ABC transport system ATP-binding protein